MSGHGLLRFFLFWKVGNYDEGGWGNVAVIYEWKSSQECMAWKKHNKIYWNK